MSIATVLLIIGWIFLWYCVRGTDKLPVNVKTPPVITPRQVNPKPSPRHKFVRPIKPPIVKELPEWFICDWVKTLEISPAEQLIIDELSKYNIRWEREVSFNGLKSSKGSFLRYDFYLYDHKVAIEYDGKQWHNDIERQTVDHQKNVFCRNNAIELIRYDSSHYYHMPYEISELMEQLNVKRK